MPARPLLVLGALGALALALAGCTSTAANTPDATSDWSDSPLSKLMAPVWGSDRSEEETAALNAKTEELVAECMKEEGFEYVPQDTSAWISSSDDWKPDDRDWVAQYGYGAIDWPGRDAMESEDQPEDPNADYVASLSESEAAAYYEVLYGPQPTQEELDASDGQWTSTWEEQGCYGAASHEVFPDPSQSSEHKPVMDAINEFYNSVYEDPGPEMAELDAAWADCMADTGHSGFEKQQDASQSIYDEQNAYYEDQTEYVEDPPEMAALQKKEIALALDDLDCREKIDYHTRSLQIQWAAEEEFIADHRAELDALVADAEQARASG